MNHPAEYKSVQNGIPSASRRVPLTRSDPVIRDRRLELDEKQLPKPFYRDAETADSTATSLPADSRRESTSSFEQSVSHKQSNGDLGILLARNRQTLCLANSLITEFVSLTPNNGDESDSPQNGEKTDNHERMSECHFTTTC